MELIDMEYTFITTKEERDALRRGEKQPKFQITRAKQGQFVMERFRQSELRLAGMKMSDEGIETLLSGIIAEKMGE
jgi:hypothetical protein